MKVFMHELSHALEHGMPNLEREIQAFFGSIDTGKKIITDAIIIQGKKVKFKTPVTYAETKIPMPSWYCTKVYNDGSVQELLSMWFTCVLDYTIRRNDMNSLIKSPTDFAKQYPEYFNAILKILRNEK